MNQNSVYDDGVVLNSDNVNTGNRIDIHHVGNSDQNNEFN